MYSMISTGINVRRYGSTDMTSGVEIEEWSGSEDCEAFGNALYDGS